MDSGDSPWYKESLEAFKLLIEAGYSVIPFETGWFDGCTLPEFRFGRQVYSGLNEIRELVAKN